MVANTRIEERRFGLFQHKKSLVSFDVYRRRVFRQTYVQIVIVNCVRASEQVYTRTRPRLLTLSLVSLINLFASFVWHERVDVTDTD